LAYNTEELQLVYEFWALSGIIVYGKEKKFGV
jgi:hypothetical protein